MKSAITAIGITKGFKRHTRKKFLTLKSTLIRDLWRERNEAEDLFWALNGVDLEVPRGTTVGLIGANGSGKSTLLKIIAGILKPTTGTISVNGRISALIELGAGFHPEISGRENIYINGIMLGLTKREIHERFDDIVAFSELGDFIDNPVKSYSSGMYMRLGFSVAVHVNPEILLIDEVLAVGDQGFVYKCIDRIYDFKRQRKTILLVTHNLGAVEKLCDEAVWLSLGKVKDRGHSRRVIDSYLMDVKEKDQERFTSQHEAITAAIEEMAETLSPDENCIAISSTEQVCQTSEPVPDLPNEVPLSDPRMRWGSREIEIYRVKIYNRTGEECHLFESGDAARITMWYRARKRIEEPVFGIGIFLQSGMAVYGSNTDLEKIELAAVSGEGTVTVDLERLDLVEGTYSFDVAVHAKDGTPYDYHCHLYPFAIRTPISDIGIYRPLHSWSFEPELREEALSSEGHHEGP